MPNNRPATARRGKATRETRPSSQFPPTRYQGSKRKLAAAIIEQLEPLDYATVLDAFGGTGSVSYAFKSAGKAVTYNDILAFNHQIGLALIENDTCRLRESLVESIGDRRGNGAYGDLIARSFEGIYFTDEENRWLDNAVANIERMDGTYERAIAWFSLFQAAMAKRPYNLFHRKNLYMRTARVPRSFGNKKSWDRSFSEHLHRFVRQANSAVVDSGGRCRATCLDVMQVEPGFDLVYIDPPYINSSGVGVDYRDFYHFLEGLVRYERWESMIDHASRHRRLARVKSPWSDPQQCRDMMSRLFERFADSILVMSYRSDGTPSIPDLAASLRRVKGSVRIVEAARYQYALSTRRDTKEVLLVADSRSLRVPAPTRENP